MYCSKCGKETSDGSSFCAACGNNLAGKKQSLYDLKPQKNCLAGYFIIFVCPCNRIFVLNIINCYNSNCNAGFGYKNQYSGI